MTFSDLIDDFLLYCSVDRKLSANTVEAYASDLRNFARYAGLNKGSGGISTKMIRQYLTYMIKDVGLAGATAKRRMACLRSFSVYISDKHNVANPFEHWRPTVKRSRRLPRTVGREELTALLHCPSFENSDIYFETVFAVLIITATGVRVSELCDAVAGDVCLDGSCMRVQGKGARERFVYVSDTSLQNELSRRRQHRIECFGDEAPLLINLRGKQLRPQTLRRRLHQLARAAGSSRAITPHMLRHTAATLLIEHGIDIRLVQRLLGHASIATTEIYTHVSDASLRNAIISANPIANFVVGGRQ